MRGWIPVALLLTGCAEVAPVTRERPDIAGPVIQKFEDKDNFWILYNGKLVRCHFDVGKAAPVCLIPPFIKVPPDAWHQALGIQPAATTKGKAPTYPIAPDWTGTVE